jgi:hypothetical protein
VQRTPPCAKSEGRRLNLIWLTENLSYCDWWLVLVLLAKYFQLCFLTISSVILYFTANISVSAYSFAFTFCPVCWQNLFSSDAYVTFHFSFLRLCLEPSNYTSTFHTFTACSAFVRILSLFCEVEAMHLVFACLILPQFHHSVTITSVFGDPHFH